MPMCDKVLFNSSVAYKIAEMLGDKRLTIVYIKKQGGQSLEVSGLFNRLSCKT